MNEQQVKEKGKEFVRSLRLYIRGVGDADMVRNAMHCLFVDVALVTPPERAKREHFISLLRGMLK